MYRRPLEGNGIGKYEPLANYLALNVSPTDMTFAEIEKLVGQLPPSAFRYPEWWSNNANGHVQAEAWLARGRRVVQVDLATKSVRFE